MDQLVEFSAILIPSDGRPPHLVQLVTSLVTPPVSQTIPNAQPSRVPHPEVHMDYIAENLGPRAWRYHLVEALDGMNRNFANPYIIFYPTVSRDGMPFPVNKCIRAMQGRSFSEETAWRGNIVVAKYRDSPWTSLLEATMADFPLLKNYLMTHGPPQT